MPLPPASPTDVTTLDSQVRVIVHNTHIFDVQRVDGDPVKYRVNLLPSVISTFQNFNVTFTSKSWEFAAPNDAVTWAKDNALNLYNQYKAMDDAANVVRGL